MFTNIQKTNYGSITKDSKPLHVPTGGGDATGPAKQTSSKPILGNKKVENVTLKSSEGPPQKAARRPPLGKGLRWKQVT
jgi:hypothetical protein